MLSKNSSEEKRTHSSWEKSDVSFIQEAIKEEMKKGRHLEMKNNFSSLDDTFSMSMPHLKEILLPTVDLETHWFWKAMDEKKDSLRDLIGGVLKHIMECMVSYNGRMPSICRMRSIIHIGLNG